MTMIYRWLQLIYYLHQGGIIFITGANGGTVVTHSSPTSEIRVRILAGLQARKWLALGQQFTVQKLDQLYALVSSSLPTTRRDMTNVTVLKAT